jgi:hypothetical protein
MNARKSSAFPSASVSPLAAPFRTADDLLTTASGLAEVVMPLQGKLNCAVGARGGVTPVLLTDRANTHAVTSPCLRLLWVSLQLHVLPFVGMQDWAGPDFLLPTPYSLFETCCCAQNILQ